MGTQKLVLLFIFSVYSISGSANTHHFKSASEEELFRNFALSVCIGTAYAGESKKLEDNISKATSGYREYSHISLDAYEEVRAAINDWLKKDYSSKHGGQIEIMKCIDLYNHNDLQKIFQKYDPCKSQDSWLDTAEFKLRCK